MPRYLPLFGMMLCTARSPVQASAVAVQVAEFEVGRRSPLNMNCYSHASLTPAPHADMSKGGDTISALTGLPQVATSAAFSLVLGAGCAFLAPKALDKANTVLVGLVIASFLVSCPGLGCVSVRSRCLLEFGGRLVADTHILPS